MFSEVKGEPIINSLNEAETLVKKVIYEGIWSDNRFPPGRWPATINGIQGQSGFIAKVLSVQEHLGTVARLYVFFKRDTFHSFGRIFGYGNEEGQTINLEALRKANYEDALLVVVYPDGTVSYCTAKEFMRFVIDHHTVRRPGREVSEEASAPAKMLKVVAQPKVA